MIGRLTAAAGFLTISAISQAAAQSRPKEIPPKQLTGPDIGAIEEGLKTIRQAGSCTATFVVSKTAEIKDKTASCTIPEMEPFVLKAIATVIYAPLTFQGAAFDSEPIKLPFSWPAPEVIPASDAVVIRPIDPRLGAEARKQVKRDGERKAVLTVGADGVPRDIQMTCKPEAYERLMVQAVAEMRYKPAEEDGKPVEMFNQVVLLRLTQKSRTAFVQ